MFKSLRPFSWLIMLHVAVVILALVFLARQPNDTMDKEKIVVVPIEGMISFGHSAVGRGMSVETLLETLRNLEKKDDVKAVVLRINSPGGSVGAVQEIFTALKRIKSKGKIIVSSFGDVAASGGYYVACAGDGIVANSGTLTGSIGVIMQMPNVQGLMNKLGVSFQTIKSGEMKDSGSPFRPMTEKERAYFSDVIMDAYGQFFAAVKQGRKLDDATLKPLADGRIFTGSMAVKNKLVDQIGDLEDAITLAKKLAKLENKKPEIVYEKEKRSLEKLMDMVGASPLGPLTSAASTEYKLMYVLQ